MVPDFYDTATVPPVDPGRDPSRRFANPFLACDNCGIQVVWRYEARNLPCGCRADFASVCPAWTPAAGCACVDLLDGDGHGHPPALVHGHGPHPPG